MECLLPYLSMLTVPHIMVGLERMLDYRGVGLERFHCTCACSCSLLYVLHTHVRGCTYLSLYTPSPTTPCCLI